MKIRQLRPVPTLIAVLVISLLCLSEGLKVFERFEWITYDWRVKQAADWRSRNATGYGQTAANLAAVFIDDDSIKEVNENPNEGFKWPWPTMLHGKIVRELKAEGAKAVAFDVLFSELDPPNPKTDVAVSDNEVLSSDEFFARQLKEAGNVILASTPPETEGSMAVMPADLFATNAMAVGHIASEKDSDGVLRRARPFIMLNGKRIWHMGIQLAAQELHINLEKSDIDGDRLILTGKDGTIREVPLDEDGFFYINWALTWNDPRLFHLSAFGLPYLDDLRQTGNTNEFHEAIEGLREEGVIHDKGDAPFRDKLVIVGSIGLGNNISDLGTTPLETKTYLVSKHWNVANSIIARQYVIKSPLMVSIALIFFFGLLSAILTWEERPLTASLLVALIGVSYVAFADFLFVKTGYWLPIFLPTFGALILTHGVLVIHRVMFEQAEQKKIKGVFSKMVSPKIVAELLKMQEVKLGGSRREITIYFADVRGFTEMTDNVQAKAEEYVKKANLSEVEADAYFDKISSETLETVNLYLGTLSTQVTKHDGALDKYIGDCVMAFWGAPTANPKHALFAVRAAIDSQRAIFELNQKRAKENERRKKDNIARESAGQPPVALLPLLAMGSGINTGVAIVGMMGSDAHEMSYTVFGREVNLASRLEGVSGRSRIIIGENTFKHLQRDEPKLAETCVALDPVPVKGFRAPVKIYEVPWRTAEMQEEPGTEEKPATK